MANVRAFRSGNWSDTSVATSPWSNGTTVFAPTSADDVWAAGFTVTIDQAVTVLSLRNISSASQAWKDGGTAAAANGGGFSMPVAYNITATNSIQCGNATCITYSASGSATLTSASVGNSQTGNINCISITGSGTLTISSASLYGSAGGTPSFVASVVSGGLTLTNCTLSTSANNFQGGVSVGASGTLTANNCTISGGTYLANGLQNNGVSTLNSCTINAQVGTQGVSVLNNSTGTLNINNSTITGIGALSNAGGTVNAINCTFTASASGTPFTSTSGTNIVSGYFYDSSVGFPAVYLYKWRMGTAPTNGIWRVALNGSTTFVNLYTADNNLGQANPTDVRSGVSYASGNLTGRLTVPARGSVALSVNYGPSMPFTASRSGTTATATLAYSYPFVVGDQITVTGASNAEWNSTYTIASVVSGTSVTLTVPETHSSTAGTGAVMQTTGTAVLDPAAVATAVWGAATKEITGGTVTTLTNPPTVPTVVQIRQEMDSNSTKLANLDATVSSRLAATDYNAPTSAPTAASVASAVWGAATRSITGGTVDTLTNAPTVPTPSQIASQVRTELATELARVDVATSTRLAGSAYTAPSNSDIAAIKAKTDNLPASPAAVSDIPSANISAIKAKTDNLPASPAATGDIPSANISAIKAKTDLLNTDRLAQVSTVSTTGAQLAAALS